MKKPPIDLTGQTFGKWHVIDYAGKRNNAKFWNCKCECGETRPIFMGNLRNGSSSGCVHCSRSKKRVSRGVSKEKLYAKWHHLKLSTPMCDAWKTDYIAFKSAIGKWIPYMLISRIDKLRPLGPGNFHVKQPVILLPTEQKRLRESSGMGRRKLLYAWRARGATLQHLGDILGLTRERIRQLASANEVYKHIHKAEDRITRLNRKIKSQHKYIKKLGESMKTLISDAATLAQLAASD